MRAREILDEDYNQNLQSEINNLIVMAKGAGASKVNTRKFVQQLQQMGYSVDENSVIQLLQDNPAITSSTPAEIMFSEPEARAGEGDEEDSEDRVSDMAQNATNIK